MPLIVSPLLESDIPDFAIADERANEGWPFARAMEIPGIPRRVFVEEWTRKEWKRDPTLVWMKVSEQSTGEFISAALWKFPPEDAKTRGAVEIYGMTQDPEIPPLVEAEASEKEKEKEGGPNSAGNTALFAHLAKEWEAFAAENIGDRPFAHLQILMTDPKHQRRGAGSMLVKWGCDIADERGLLSALTASAAGEKVYTKHGFVIKARSELDLAPFGVEGIETRRRMIRLPNKVS